MVGTPRWWMPAASATVMTLIAVGPSTASSSMAAEATSWLDGPFVIETGRRAPSRLMSAVVLVAAWAGLGAIHLCPPVDGFGGQRDRLGDGLRCWHFRHRVLRKRAVMVRAGLTPGLAGVAAPSDQHVPVTVDVEVLVPYALVASVPMAAPPSR